MWNSFPFAESFAVVAPRPARSGWVAASSSFEGRPCRRCAGAACFRRRGGRRRRWRGAERLQLRRVADVRAGAEVGELAVGVERNFSPSGMSARRPRVVALLLHLLMIATASSRETSLRSKRWFSLGDLHLGLGWRDRRWSLLIEIDVVVEAGVGGRADVELGIWEDAEERGRQHVRARVAKFFERSHRYGSVGCGPAFTNAGP